MVKAWCIARLAHGAYSVHGAPCTRHAWSSAQVHLQVLLVCPTASTCAHPTTHRLPLDRIPLSQAPLLKPCMHTRADTHTRQNSPPLPPHTAHTCANTHTHTHRERETHKHTCVTAPLPPIPTCRACASAEGHTCQRPHPLSPSHTLFHIPHPAYEHALMQPATLMPLPYSSRTPPRAPTCVAACAASVAPPHAHVCPSFPPKPHTHAHTYTKRSHKHTHACARTRCAPV